VTIPPPSFEPDEPTTVPPKVAETQPKPHAPAVGPDQTAAPKSAAPKSAAPKSSVRKAPVRKAPARTTAARTAAARPTPAKTAGVDKANDPVAPTTVPAAKSDSATKSSAARADTAKARASRAAANRAEANRAAANRAEANRAEALASSLDQAVPDSAAPEAADPDLAVVEATVTEQAPAPTKAVRTPKKASARSPRSTTKRGAKTAPPVPEGPPARVVVAVTGLKKRFGTTIAVSGIDLEVREGSFYGIVGPNGAGKTTTLSMITGLLRPDAGAVHVRGIDVWGNPIAAKRVIGVLPDRLRLFDRLTGAQLLYYSGVLRGLDGVTVRKRSADLAAAFGLEDALNRLVADYSAGMTRKIALACAMIHSPRVLVLDEPFESVDPVSAVNVTEILQKYVASGGTVLLSSHGMDLIQRVCDHVAIIVQGAVLASGTIDEVRGENTLEERFIELAGGRKVAEGMEWLHSFSD
jgi:ABC-type multidrug transport system ATPase subunit